MTDTDFVLLVDQIRDASPERLNAIMRDAEGDPLRQRLFDEALAFYGLTSFTHRLWSGAVDGAERDAAIRELIALRTLTPMDDAAPGWLHHCLQGFQGFQGLQGLQGLQRLDVDDGLSANQVDAHRWAEIRENLQRLERESPVEEGLLRHAGLSMDEVRAVLPDTDSHAQRPRPVRSRVREPRSDRSIHGSKDARRPVKTRLPKWAHAGVVVLLLIAIPGLSAVTRSPAVSWTMSDARLQSAPSGSAVRGMTGESVGETVDAEGAVMIGWAITARLPKHVARYVSAFPARGNTACR